MTESDKFIKLPIIRSIPNMDFILNLVKEYNGMIIGGFARYVCSTNSEPVKPGDIDIYFCDEDDYNNFFLDNVIDKIDGQVKEFNHNKPFIRSRMTRNAISFTTNPDYINYDIIQSFPIISIVKPINEGHKVASGTPEVIMSNFDFSVTRAYIISSTECLVDSDFIEDEEDKFLRIKNIHCPISSTFRFIKYCKKGYKTNTREIVKLFKDWDNRDDEYRDKLITFLEKEDPTQEDIEEGEALLNID